MSKEELIKTGEYLLSVTFKKDVYGIGSEDFVLSDEDTSKARKWEEDLHIFLLWLKDDHLRVEIESLFPLTNGNRFRTEATKKIMRILKEVVE
ncbi:MAG: hypothetical protein IJT30_08465 [Muribaculaceae bacterium]|nr:hypothetical protein [Muribaculaceae bacterium]